MFTNTSNTYRENDEEMLRLLNSIDKNTTDSKQKIDARVVVKYDKDLLFQDAQESIQKALSSGELKAAIDYGKIDPPLIETIGEVIRESHVTLNDIQYNVITKSTAAIKKKLDDDSVEIAKKFKKIDEDHQHLHSYLQDSVKPNFESIKKTIQEVQDKLAQLDDIDTELQEVKDFGTSINNKIPDSFGSNTTTSLSNIQSSENEIKDYLEEKLPELKTNVEGVSNALTTTNTSITEFQSNQDKKLDKLSALLSSITTTLNIDDANIYDMINYITTVDDNSLSKLSDLEKQLKRTMEALTEMKDNYEKYKDVNTVINNNMIKFKEVLQEIEIANGFNKNFKDQMDNMELMISEIDGESDKTNTFCTDDRATAIDEANKKIDQMNLDNINEFCSSVKKIKLIRFMN